MSKPLRGDVIWSAPTLLTLNPIGAPIAHIGLHTSVVLHSYETDTFLPRTTNAAYVDGLPGLPGRRTRARSPS